MCFACKQAKSWRADGLCMGRRHRGHGTFEVLWIQVTSLPYSFTLIYLRKKELQMRMVVLLRSKDLYHFDHFLVSLCFSLACSTRHTL